jgi:hypothetical protein
MARWHISLFQTCLSDITTQLIKCNFSSYIMILPFNWSNAIFHHIYVVTIYYMTSTPIFSWPKQTPPNWQFMQGSERKYSPVASFSTLRNTARVLDGVLEHPKSRWSACLTAAARLWYTEPMGLVHWEIVKGAFGTTVPMAAVFRYEVRGPLTSTQPRSH